MNEYKLISPPGSLAFREMSRQELRAFYAWYMAVIPERVAEMTRAVQRDPDMAWWRPDETPASLSPLGEWMALHIEMRPRTLEEMEALGRGLPAGMIFSREELTRRSISLALDAGMYLSQVFLRRHPTLQWTQRFNGRRSIDYGRPLLIEFEWGAFNPIHMGLGVAYKMGGMRGTGGELRKIYELWAAKVGPPPRSIPPQEGEA